MGNIASMVAYDDEHNSRPSPSDDRERDAAFRYERDLDSEHDLHHVATRLQFDMEQLALRNAHVDRDPAPHAQLDLSFHAPPGGLGDLEMLAAQEKLRATEHLMLLDYLGRDVWTIILSYFTLSNKPPPLGGFIDQPFIEKFCSPRYLEFPSKDEWWLLNFRDSIEARSELESAAVIAAGSSLQEPYFQLLSHRGAGRPLRVIGRKDPIDSTVVIPLAVNISSEIVTFSAWYARQTKRFLDGRDQSALKDATLDSKWALEWTQSPHDFVFLFVMQFLHHSNKISGGW